MKFGLVYDSTNTHITAQNLRDVLAESQSIRFDLSILKPDADIEELIKTAEERGTSPDVILCEIGAPGLPHGLQSVSAPTVCLDIDSFGWTPFRLRWAMLFDYVFTWHPSYVRRYQEAGHPRVFTVPHAVNAELFADINANHERFYDLGFVGNSELAQYGMRNRVISQLARLYRTNDFQRKYDKQEMAEIYKRSRIVVNVSRAEFPQEANMRCYEAMAGGALLITGVPTELTEWGFSEGVHFVGWRNECELSDLVNRFLRDEKKRSEIAQAGRERTLKSFTFQRCIDSIASTVAKDNGEVFAPARGWTPEDVHLLYLSYYYRYGLHCAALEEFRLLRRANPKTQWRGLLMVLKTLRHALKRSLM
jgi:spore maturation protein CgeB